MLLRSLALMVSLLAPALPQTVRADVGFVHVVPDLVLAQPCGAAESCSYTWTTATRLGDALNHAEMLFGDRDPSWTLLGVEFAATEAPQVWYPDFGRGYNSVVVQLTQESARDEKQALFQLAHEVVHLLSPNGPDAPATVLEEGLATYHSIEYLRAKKFEISASYIDAPAYEAAYASILELESVQPEFAMGIRRLRARRGGLSAISAADLRAEFPAITPALADRLAQRF